MNVLFLEDNVAYSRSVKRYLKSQGYSVTHFKYLEDARNYIRSNKFDADLALIDINVPLRKVEKKDISSLPISNGLELINEINIRDQAVPILVITGNDNESNRFKAQSKGIFQFLTKSDTKPEYLMKWIDHGLFFRKIYEQIKIFDDRFSKSILRESITFLLKEVIQHTSDIFSVNECKIICSDQFYKVYERHSKSILEIEKCDDEKELQNIYYGSDAMIWDGRKSPKLLNDYLIDDYPLKNGVLSIPIFSNDFLLMIVQLKIQELPYFHVPLRNYILQTLPRYFNEVYYKYKNKTEEQISYNSNDILTAMRPGQWSGLYIVGSFDDRVTFYDQQIRSLNLVKALVESGDVEKGHKIAVIGGGAAGATAAVALVNQGCLVTLYEKGSTLFRLQIQSKHRYIHPHIYDWPHVNSEGVESINSNAGLCFLDWDAGTADKVVDKLRKEVTSYEKQTKLLEIKYHSKITDLKQISEGTPLNRIQVLGNECLINDKFNCVIVAIGFGVEDNFNTPAYWVNDELDSEKEASVFISGSGDGALTDVARSCIREYKIDDYIDFFNSNRDFVEFALAMRKIDDSKMHRDKLYTQDDESLFSRYTQIDGFEELCRKFQRKSLDRFRVDTQVTFNYAEDSIFNVKSCVLNKLIVLLLFKCQQVNFLYGKVEKISREGKKYCVRIQGKEDLFYDYAVARHGPPSDHVIENFSCLKNDVDVLKSKLRLLNISRKLSVSTRQFYLGS